MKNGDKLHAILHAILNQVDADGKLNLAKRSWEYDEIRLKILSDKSNLWIPKNPEIDGLCEILIQDKIVDPLEYTDRGRVGISINRHEYLRSANSAYYMGKYKSDEWEGIAKKLSILNLAITVILVATGAIQVWQTQKAQSFEMQRALTSIELQISQLELRNGMTEIKTLRDSISCLNERLNISRKP